MQEESLLIALVRGWPANRKIRRSGAMAFESRSRASGTCAGPTRPPCS